MEITTGMSPKISSGIHLENRVGIPPKILHYYFQFIEKCLQKFMPSFFQKFLQIFLHVVSQKLPSRFFILENFKS